MMATLGIIALLFVSAGYITVLAHRAGVLEREG